jgi:hypothetical protein
VQQQERETLQEETRTAIEEARMVLPGIQALFGFQLIVIFNDHFEKLPPAGRLSHLVSMGFIVLAIVFTMAPAAFHRISERGWVSRGLIRITSNFVTAGMAMLMLALPLEFTLVSLIVVHDPRVAIGMGGVLFVLLATCWFVLPLKRRKRLRSRERDD